MRNHKLSVSVSKNSINPKQKPLTITQKHHKRTKSDKISPSCTNINSKCHRAVAVNAYAEKRPTFEFGYQLERRPKPTKIKEALRGSDLILQSQKASENRIDLIKHSEKRNLIQTSDMLFEQYTTILKIADKLDMKHKLRHTRHHSSQLVPSNNSKNLERHQISQNRDEDISHLLCADETAETLKIRRPAPFSAMSRYEESEELPAIQQRAKSQEDYEDTVQSKKKSGKSTIVRGYIEQKVERSDKKTAEDSAKSTVSQRRMLYDPLIRPFIQPFRLNQDIVDVLNRRRRKIKLLNHEK